MSENEMKLVITFAAVFEKLKIFKSLLPEAQLESYELNLQTAKTLFLEKNPSLSPENRKLLDEHFS